MYINYFTFLFILSRRTTYIHFCSTDSIFNFHLDPTNEQLIHIEEQKNSKNHVKNGKLGRIFVQAQLTYSIFCVYSYMVLVHLFM